MIGFYVGITILGAVVGSFANVVALRLNTGRPILAGRSSCGSCTTQLRWFELLPILSYVIQAGKCRSCGSRIAIRYVLVEILFALCFLAAALAFGSTPLLVVVLFGLSILGSIVLYDIAHTIIPDLLVVLFGIVSVISFLLQWQLGISPLYPTLLAALTMSAFFALLWLVSKGRWIGLGDAKLVLALALFVGFPEAVHGFVLAFWIGAVVSLVLLVLSQKHRTISHEVPFGPYLALGFICAFIFDIHVVPLIG